MLLQHSSTEADPLNDNLRRQHRPHDYLSPKTTSYLVEGIRLFPRVISRHLGTVCQEEDPKTGVALP